MATLQKGKKRILTILLTGFVLVFLMLLLQTMSAKYSTLYYVPWLWFAILYVPPVIFLYRLKIENKEINMGGVTALSILFVFATILSIFLQALALTANNEISLPYLSRVETLKISAFFLLPLEGLLMYLIWKTGRDGKILLQDPKVFISYNHRDRVMALKIKAVMEAAGVPVIMDQFNMKAGTDIKEFIQNSLKEATAIVSLVSNRSLESAWVAKETIDTLFLETYMENKKFIACYLDDDFFQNGYTSNTVAKIDIQLNDIQNLITKAGEQGIDTRDLNNQKSRLLVLRNGLDGIIGRLRDSLCLDIRDTTFDQSMEKLLNAVKADGSYEQ